MTYQIDPVVCHNTRCTESYIPHREGKIDSLAKGWFEMRDGKAWCPKHIPTWVSGWRAKKYGQKDGM